METSNHSFEKDAIVIAIGHHLNLLAAFRQWRAALIDSMTPANVAGDRDARTAKVQANREAVKIEKFWNASTIVMERL
ncbi:hypothetical protein ICY20_21835 [Pseudomonas sp. P115]|uniref:hypothetical protein n=1 Tax=Pseudomonas pisciculturae TaxID=2730413 RepID=UPI0018923778|nr:hypothetical protein [Pseudomonas pisciculturae]MBF6030396.1 hypothetical protein [Pseudomonas pisciculturae]